MVLLEAAVQHEAIEPRENVPIGSPECFLWVMTVNLAVSLAMSASWSTVCFELAALHYLSGQKIGIKRVAIIQARKFKGAPTRKKSTNLYCPGP